MAITYQISVDAGTTNGTVALTQTIAVSSGSNLVLFAATTVDVNATDRNPTCSSDLDGALTLIAEDVGTTSGQNCAAFYKINPTVGTHTLTHSTDLVNTSEFIMGMAIVLEGVHQSTPSADPLTAGGSVAALSLTPASGLTADDWVLDFACINGAPTVTVGADQTARGDTPTPAGTGGAGGAISVCSTQPGSAGGAMTHSWTGTQRTSHVAFIVKAAAAAGGGAGPNLLLLGVGAAVYGPAWWRYQREQQRREREIQRAERSILKGQRAA